MDKKYWLKCPECSSILALKIGYTGCDWCCEAGEGSGYGWEISLDCYECGHIYTLGHIKNLNDFSIVNKKFRTFNNGVVSYNEKF